MSEQRKTASKSSIDYESSNPVSFSVIVSVFI